MSQGEGDGDGSVRPAVLEPHLEHLLFGVVGGGIHVGAFKALEVPFRHPRLERGVFVQPLEEAA